MPGTCPSRHPDAKVFVDERGSLSLTVCTMSASTDRGALLRGEARCSRHFRKLRSQRFGLALAYLVDNSMFALAVAASEWYSVGSAGD